MPTFRIVSARFFEDLVHHDQATHAATTVMSSCFLSQVLGRPVAPHWHKLANRPQWLRMLYQPIPWIQWLACLALNQLLLWGTLGLCWQSQKIQPANVPKRTAKSWAKWFGCKRESLFRLFWFIFHVYDIHMYTVSRVSKRHILSPIKIANIIGNQLTIWLGPHLLFEYVWIPTRLCHNRWTCDAPKVPVLSHVFLVNMSII